mmetsp:Transcript_26700/g.67923  ORF Transcript_26700/g.67923 Transcript_26700/m.67923 type:complete len:213 (-) Transcript_26700:163-801(-)
MMYRSGESCESVWSHCQLLPSCPFRVGPMIGKSSSMLANYLCECSVYEDDVRSSRRKLRKHVALPSNHHTSTAEGRAHEFLEFVAVRCEQVGSLLVEWVISIWLQHEELQTMDDALDREHGLPVFPQDVEAHMSLHVNIRVIHSGFAEHLWCVVWVRLRYLDVEHELPLSVVAFVRTDLHLEVHQVVLSIVKVDRDSFIIIPKLTDVFLHAN